MNSFNELCKRISHDIDAKDMRTRSRTEQEQLRFDYAVITKEILPNFLYTHKIKVLDIKYNYE